MSNNRCPNCKESLIAKAKFCTSCGYSVDGIKGVIKGFQKRFQHQSKDWVDNIRNTVDVRVGDMLKTIEDNKQLKIFNYTVPEARNDTIKNALLTFQSKMGGEEEKSEEFRKWAEKLPDMLDEQKCIVCYSSWADVSNIVVCKHCRSGGHREHLTNWVNTEKTCPLCRQALTVRGLLSINP